MAELSHSANPSRTRSSFHPFEGCQNAEAFVLIPFWPEDPEVAYKYSVTNFRHRRSSSRWTNQFVSGCRGGWRDESLWTPDRQPNKRFLHEALSCQLAPFA